MPTDRWPYWVQEYAGSNRLPSVASVFLRLLLLLAILVALGAWGPAVAEAERQGRKYPSLCDEHAGRPGWQSVCGGRYTPPPPAKR